MKFTIIFHIDDIDGGNMKGYWVESPDNPNWFIAGKDFNDVCTRIEKYFIPNLRQIPAED